MVVTLFIVLDNTFLDTFRGNIKCQVDVTVRTFWGCQYSKFYSIQGTSCITACHIREKIKSVIINYSPIVAHTLIAVIDCPENESTDIVLTQRSELKNNRT